MRARRSAGTIAHIEDKERVCRPCLVEGCLVTTYSIGEVAALTYSLVSLKMLGSDKGFSTYVTLECLSAM